MSLTQPDIVERLRDKATPIDAAMIAEAADEIATLQARAVELTKALREISDLYVNAPGWAAPAPSHEREYKMHQIARRALAVPLEQEKSHD